MKRPKCVRQSVEHEATLKSESIWTWMVGQELVDVPVKLDPKGRMPVTRL